MEWRTVALDSAILVQCWSEMKSLTLVCLLVCGVFSTNVESGEEQM